MIPVRSLLAASSPDGEGRVSRSLWTRSRPRRRRSQALGAGRIPDPAPRPRPARAHECIGSWVGGWDAAHPSVCRTDVHMSRVGGSTRPRMTKRPRCAAAATVRPACLYSLVECALEGARPGVHLWADGWARHAHACMNLPGARWATRTPSPHAYGVHLRVAGWAWRVLAPCGCPALSLRPISAMT
jgi:hypothetical protein